MKSVLQIDGQAVPFVANALTPRLYRHRFGRDVIRDLNRLRQNYDKAAAAQHISPPGPDASPGDVAAYEKLLQEAQLSVLDLEIFEDIAYIMAKQGDPDIPGSSEEWLERFNIFSIYQVLPEILKLWQLNQQTTSASKKK